jgi:membrane protease YdiL (CAAX protease family)
MTDITQDTARPPWGPWATLGWFVLAIVLAAMAGFAAVVLLWPDRLTDTSNLMKDGPLIGLTTLVSAVVQIGVLALAAWLARWPVGEYLGLVWPQRRNLMTAIVLLAVFVAAMDALAYLAGRDVVTPFQVDTYRSSRDAGTLPLLWFTFAIAGPAAEEIVFRGFLYRGWVTSARGALPGILLISALFAIIHLQYDWFGIGQVFLVGLALGLARWWSGSTALTILMHVVINLWATVQSMVKVEWLS